MALPREARPQLGSVIPLGSGNDYARTLGSWQETTSRARWPGVRVARRVEVGRVNVARRFMQTLVWPDAAIALDTTNRRAAGDLQEGEALFVTSALRILSTPARASRSASFDGKTQDLSASSLRCSGALLQRRL